MADGKARDAFSKSLLADVAEAELPFYDDYSAALVPNARTEQAGVGFGLPPEVMGLIGIAAVAVGHAVYDLLASWVADVAEDIARKYLVDMGSAKLRAWLGASDGKLDDVLTSEGRLRILAVVEQESEAAGLSAEDTKRLKSAVLRRLGI